VARWFGGTLTAVPIFTLPHRHRWFARVVLACLCLAVLAPTLSRLIQSARGVPVWQVVCRSDGSAQAVKLMQVRLFAGQLAAPADQTGRPDHGAAHEGDCPMCVLQHVAAAPPGDAGSLTVDPALRHVRPTLFWHAPAPLHAWAAPLSRGPPNRV